MPIAASTLNPFFETLPSPIIAATAMSLRSVRVIANALGLRHLYLDTAIPDSPAMGKSYHLEFRRRAIAAAHGSNVSWRQLAADLGVAPNTLINWWQQDLEGGRRSNCSSSKIAGPDRAWLRHRIREGEFTLRTLVAELAARGLNVDTKTIANFIEAQRQRGARGALHRKPRQAALYDKKRHR